MYEYTEMLPRSVKSFDKMLFVKAFDRIIRKSINNYGFIKNIRSN